MTERRHGSACVAAVLLGLAVAGVSLAQQSVVDRCREAPTDKARIACLEQALLGKGATAEQPVSDGVPEPAAEPALDPPPQPPEKRSTVEAAPTGIGAEQVRARTESAAEREARLASVTALKVAGYREVPYQRLQVELENGQVWQQIKGDTQRVRVDLTRNQTVDIEQSSLGGYKLRLNELRRTIRVERVR